jgi:hypothetical protein
MRIVLITLLAALLGFLTVLLLPFLFLVWFDAYWRRHEVEAHLSVQYQAGDVEEALTEDPLPDVFQRWMDGRK